MKEDIEIAREVKLQPIEEIGAKLGIEKLLLPFGCSKAKVAVDQIDLSKRRGKMILVTAMNPTPAGEGKTTMAIGLSMALNRLGKNAVVGLREPSLGPVFGIKGGAAGGGYSQVLPMEDINLHFTGDLHAITSAHNLMAAAIDTRMYHESRQSDAALFRRLCPPDRDGNRKFAPLCSNVSRNWASTKPTPMT